MCIYTYIAANCLKQGIPSTCSTTHVGQRAPPSTLFVAKLISLRILLSAYPFGYQEQGVTSSCGPEELEIPKPEIYETAWTFYIFREIYGSLLQAETTQLLAPKKPTCETRSRRPQNSPLKP